MEREPLTYAKLEQIIGDLFYSKTDEQRLLDGAVLEEPVPGKPGYINLRSSRMQMFNVKKSDWDQALKDEAVAFINSNS